MDLLDILIIAVGLAMDAFTVCLGVGTLGNGTSRRAAFRLSFHFGLFQFLMPVLGWLLGAAVAPFISSVDHWIAFALLAFVGGRMVRSGLDGESEAFRTDPSRGLTLVGLAIATSIDALAVGLSLAMLRINVLYPSLVIGIVTASLSLAGLRIGNGLGTKFGKRMEIAGGLVLILIGVRIVLSHLFG